MAWVTRQQETNSKTILKFLGSTQIEQFFTPERFFFNRFQTFLQAEEGSIQWRPCSPSGHSIFNKTCIGTEFGGKVVGFFILDAGV